MDTELTTAGATKDNASNFTVEQVEGDDRAFMITHKLPNGIIRTFEVLAMRVDNVFCENNNENI